MNLPVRKFMSLDSLSEFLAEENPSYNEEMLILAQEDFESDYDDQWEPIYDSNGYLLGYLEII